MKSSGDDANDAVAVLGWGLGAQAPKSCPGPQMFTVITVHKLLKTGQLDTVVPVSYTHLTLPTKRIV